MKLADIFETVNSLQSNAEENYIDDEAKATFRSYLAMIEDEGKEYANNWLVTHKHDMFTRVFDNDEDRNLWWKKVELLMDNYSV